MNCTYCGIEFTGRKRKYCSKDCCKSNHGQNPNYKPETNCLICGKSLSPGQKKYCSGACNSMAYYKRKHPLPFIRLVKKCICKQCGEEFVNHTGGTRTKGTNSFCSKKCYGQWRRQQPRKVKAIKTKTEKHCKICGKETPNRHQVYCSDECRKQRARIRSFEVSSRKKEIKERSCKECGKPFTPEYGNKKRMFCSEFCSHKNTKRNSKKKREALKRGNRAESFNVISVFNRDKWKCQLCGIKTPRKLRGTYNDNAPELDHIIPLSKGGEHSMRNTQCACRQCNIKKGSKEIGQLRLFG